MTTEKATVDDAIVAKVKQKLSAKRNGAEGVPPLLTHSAREIDQTELPKVEEVIPGVICIGGTLFAGKPKEGKTYAIIDMGTAVASGGKAFGAISCEQGDALLLLLEDNKGRFKRRMTQLLGDQPKPERLTVAFREGTLRFNNGLFDQIRRWHVSVKRPRFVAIDTLAAARPLELDRRSVFQVEYEMLAEVNRLAHELHIAIVVVHHLRKMRSDDFLDDISGTAGLAASVDAVAALRRLTAGGFELVGRGRDIEDFEIGLERGDGKFRKVGSAADLRMTGERRTIMRALIEAKGEMPLADIAKATGLKANNVRRMLERMILDNEPVEKTGRGMWQATRSPDSPVHTAVMDFTD